MNHDLEDVLVSPGDLLISAHEEDADDEEFTLDLVTSEGLEQESEEVLVAPLDDDYLIDDEQPPELRPIGIDDEQPPELRPSGDVEDVQSANRTRSIYQPSREEIRRHCVTHMPFRNWCPICVAARGRDLPHRSTDAERSRGLPEIHFDYCFMRDANGSNQVTVLVGI